MKRFLSLLVGLAAAGLSFAAPTKTAEPLRIAFGQEVKLTDYLVPGKTTVFDFTSKFCGPCRAYDQPLHELHTRRADLVVVKVDINRPDVKGIDWESPVAKQFELHSIPHFKVYGPDGKLLGEDKIAFGADGRPTQSDSAGRRLVHTWLQEGAK